MMLCSPEGQNRGGAAAPKGPELAEARSAAAGALGVWVVDFEPGLLDRLGVVEGRADEHASGRLVTYESNVAVFGDVVVIGDFGVEEHLVAEPRASAWAYGDAQCESLFVLSVDELSDLGCCVIGQGDHGS